jgi:hypothetical protein
MNPEINTALRTHQVERSEDLAMLHYYLSHNTTKQRFVMCITNGEQLYLTNSTT